MWMECKTKTPQAALGIKIIEYINGSDNHGL